MNILLVHVRALFLVLFLVSFTSIASENIQSLNGQWSFSNQIFYDSQKLISANYVKWDKLSVPGNWDTTEKYNNFSGKGYYQRNFNVSNKWQNKNIRLKFNAVYQTAKIWLNGELLGQHIGGYTPFEFNINKYLKYNQPNSLVVMADNTYKRGAWWAWGGISRDVSLIADEDVRIVYQHITATPDFNEQIVNFSIKYKLKNYSEQPITASLSTIISDNKKKKRLIQSSILLPANNVSFKEISFVDELNAYKLWDHNNPNLYQLSSKVVHQQRDISKIEDNFGVRKFEVRGEQFFLNNKSIRLNGVNRVHDHPKFGNTEPNALVLKDMEDIKALGANFSRLMHSPQAPNLLDICDRLGYIIIGEIPVWGDDDPQTFGGNPQTKEWLNEMVERDFNHPSIVGWSVGNELRDSKPKWGEKTLTSEQYQYVNSMLDHLTDIDPTRLKTYVSITAYGVNAKLSNEPFEKLDFISINSYGDAIKNVENTHKKFPGKPIFLSEVGLKQIGGTKEAALDPRLVGYLNKLKDYPYLTGFSIWSYNDYRSDYKGTPESGFREWGIVDEQRNKKAAYYQLKDIFKYWKN